MRQEAQTLREKAALREGRIEKLRESGAKAPSFAEGFASIDPKLLERQFKGLGASWETTTTSALKSRTKELQALQEKDVAADRTIAVERSRLEQQRQLVEDQLPVRLHGNVATTAPLTKSESGRSSVAPFA